MLIIYLFSDIVILPDIESNLLEPVSKCKEFSSKMQAVVGHFKSCLYRQKIFESVTNATILTQTYTNIAEILLCHGHRDKHIVL